jgi:hypothetical protein
MDRHNRLALYGPQVLRLPPLQIRRAPAQVLGTVEQTARKIRALVPNGQRVVNFSLSAAGRPPPIAPRWRRHQPGPVGARTPSCWREGHWPR